MSAKNKEAPALGTLGPEGSTQGAQATGAASIASADRAVAAGDRFAAVPAALQTLSRWLLWAYGAPTRPGGKPRKVPHYLRGGKRRGAQGASADLARLAEFNAVVAKAAPANLGGIGLAVIEGDSLVAVDFDATSDVLSEAEAVALCGDTYMERSPSGKGFRAFYFGSMQRIDGGLRGIEVFSARQFVTVTGDMLAGSATIVAPLSDSLRDKLVELSGANAIVRDDGPSPPSNPVGMTIEQVRKMLQWLPPDWCDLYKRWLNVGMALHHEFAGSDEALTLWNEWSKSNPAKYEADACAERWPGFGKAAVVFTLWALRKAAIAAGWTALPTTVQAMAEFQPVATPTKFTLESATEVMANRKLTDDLPVLGALLPVGVVLFAGKGGTGKTTVLATAAAHVTTGLALPPWEARSSVRKPGAVLWLTVEEDVERIVIPRHQELSGNMDTFYKPKIERAQTAEGHWFAVEFDIEKHLRGLFEEAQRRRTPIRLVVCDSLPGLIQWGRRSSTNDSDVKQILGRLGQVANEFECCIAGIAHWNKKTDLAEDYRMSGAQAWRETPRLSFTCERGYIYVNKSNDMEEIGCTFAQEVVKVLREIPAETEDGEPIKITARRAMFGLHLLRKDKLLDLKKVAAVELQDSEAHRKPRREEQMRVIVEALFELVDWAPIPTKTVWRELVQEYGSAPNGEERKAVLEQLGLASQGRGSKGNLISRTRG